jgi:hypothetical protein
MEADNPDSTLSYLVLKLIQDEVVTSDEEVMVFRELDRLRRRRLAGVG